MTKRANSGYRRPALIAPNAAFPVVHSEITRRLQQASPRAMEEATRRAHLVLGYLHRGEPLLSGADMPLHVSMRTFYRWLAAYRAAEKAYGNGLVGLIPRITAAPSEDLAASGSCDFVGQNEPIGRMVVESTRAPAIASGQIELQTSRRGGRRTVGKRRRQAPMAPERRNRIVEGYVRDGVYPPDVPVRTVRRWAAEYREVILPTDLGRPRDKEAK